MALATPTIKYNAAGAGFVNLAAGANANLVVNTSLVVALQSSSGVVQATWQISAPGTIFDKQDFTVTAAPWQFQIQLPITPTEFTITTVVSDGQNATTCVNTFSVLPSSLGAVVTGTGVLVAISNTLQASALGGTAGQVMVTASNLAPLWVTPSGDTTWGSGTPGNTTVVGIQTVPVSSSLPSSGQVLASNGSAWVPTTLAAVNLPNLQGDANGMSNATKVVGIQGVTVSNASPSNNQVLASNGSAWAPTTLTANQLPNLAGDVTGAINATVVGRINAATVGQTSTGAVNNVLRISAANTLTYSAINLAGGSSWVTGALPAANQSNQAMGGDVSGFTNAATVIALQGNSLSSSAPSNNQVLSWVAATSKWTPTTIANNVISLGGDVTGFANATTVGAIQGVAVSATPPTQNQVLTGTSSNTWAPAAAPGQRSNTITNSSATQGFVVPVGIVMLTINGCGGGGGGGGGSQGQTSGTAGGGGGGGGAPWGSVEVPVVAGSNLQVNVGAGGAGGAGGASGSGSDGSRGSATTVGYSNGQILVSFVAASGGKGGSSNTSGLIAAQGGLPFTSRGSNLTASVYTVLSPLCAGAGGFGGATINSVSVTANSGQGGMDALWAALNAIGGAGGSGGTETAGNAGGTGGGGGGAGAYGSGASGGAGANGSAGAASAGTAGGNAAAVAGAWGSGGGGGGGGANGGGTGSSGGAGGAGQQGFVQFSW